MDEKPFLVVNMLDLSDNDIEQLKKFHKSYYNEQDILSTAQELQITIQIKDLLTKNFQDPGEEFTRYFVRCLNDWKSTAKQIELYKPILKKSIASVINDIISDRLNVAMKNENKDEKGIVTTQEEIDAYNIVRSILRQYVDVSRIQYNDYKTYFSVNIDGSTWWWICRIYIGKRSKKICLPKDNYKTNEWIDIETIDDIFNYADGLKEGLDLALKEANYWLAKKNELEK